MSQNDRQDDRQAIELLYGRHGQELLRYLDRFCKPGLSAEDLLQETFVQAWRNLRKVRAADSARAYLFGIARRVALNNGRRRRSYLPLPDGLSHQDGQVDDRLQDMREALGLLPDRLREPLELRLNEQLTEIAMVLEVPVGTVRSRLHEALARLRACLTDGSDDDEHKK